MINQRVANSFKPKIFFAREREINETGGLHLDTTRRFAL